MSMNMFVEGRRVPYLDSSQSYPHVAEFYDHYDWAEQVYRSGEMVAAVAVYRNIPEYLQHDLDLLISETYRKKLLNIPFLEASLLLLASGVLPEFQSLSRRSKAFGPDCRLELEQQRAIEFVTARNPNDIVVMVMRSGRLIETMTLFSFERKQDIPSLSYLEMDPAFEQLPNVPALEVGRLAKTTCNGSARDDSENCFADMAALAAAFIAAQRYISDKGLLGSPSSFICGDTHGTLIKCLKRFFPLTVVDSRINPEMLKNGNNARGMSIYFLQRQVLGSFESSDELLATIQQVAASDPGSARRIKELLDLGLRKLGVASIRQFDPKRFRVHFFHFPFHHPKTSDGLAKMSHMMQWMTDRPGRSQRTLN